MFIVIVKIDVSVLNKIHINVKENVLTVNNHNIGMLLIKCVKIVLKEIIIRMKIKYVNHVLF